MATNIEYLAQRQRKFVLILVKIFQEAGIRMM